MISEKRIHIISFDVPYPANYGGVIDVYNKIKTLAESGVEVILHTFQYGRTKSAELDRLCKKVFYYKRKVYKDPFFSKLPYIVATRNSSELLENLKHDNAPILFEGLHCCYFLDNEALKNRYKIVRMHNIEHVYYKNLARIEKNLFKKYFFSVEAQRLQLFEKKLKYANAVAAISPDDYCVLNLKYANVFYLPVFHANEEIDGQPGKGNYALYHGNLSVGENNEAALYLVNKIFKGLPYKLVIAGMNPSKELKRAVEENANIQLKDKVSTEEIMHLISNAQVNVLPTFQSTGMKLKLINVLYQGRHCLVNPKMVHNTGLESLCHTARTDAEMKRYIEKLMKLPFHIEDIGKRAKLLAGFNTRRNVNILLDKLSMSRVQPNAGFLPVPPVPEIFESGHNHE